MNLIQILLPLRDNNGNAFPSSSYSVVRRELTQRFGGLTAFTRAPAEGLWKDGHDAVAKDNIVIFEVMVDELEDAWWQKYKNTLKAIFSQDEIFIRVQDIRLI